MLKIVYPICCGMDVHKNFVVACIATTDDKGVTTYQKKRFSTFTSDLRRCASWLFENNCTNVCMESTGKYWIPVYNTLESTCLIVLAHPKYVKAIRGKKTAEKDAKWIADIFKQYCIYIFHVLGQAIKNYNAHYNITPQSLDTAAITANQPQIQANRLILQFCIQIYNRPHFPQQEMRPAL